MPPTKAALPPICPSCEHDIAALFVRSRTSVTVTCAWCHHLWDVELEDVPEQLRITTSMRPVITH